VTTGSPPRGAGYYEEAFRMSNCPSEEIEMPGHLFHRGAQPQLGTLKKANSYLGCFTNLHKNGAAEMKENPKLNLIIINKLDEKAQNTLGTDQGPGKTFSKTSDIPSNSRSTQ